jgi:hypothetical protein
MKLLFLGFCLCIVFLLENVSAQIHKVCKIVIKSISYLKEQLVLFVYRIQYYIMF